MSSDIFAPTESDDVYWAETPSGTTVTDPGGATRLAGYPDDQIVPAAGWNWLWRAWSRIIHGILKTGPRIYPSVSEALAESSTYAPVAAPSQFVVYQADGLLEEHGSEAYSVTGPIALSNIGFGCVDGRRVFVSYTLEVYAIDPTDGSTDTAWGSSGLYTWGASGSISCMCSDGAYLFLANDGTVTSLKQLDATDGSILNTIAVVTLSDPKDIESNGQVVAVADGTNIHVIGTLDGTPALVGSYAHDTGGSPVDLICCCVDHQRVYIGGNRAATRDDADVRGCPLSGPGTPDWSTQIGTSATCVVNDIVTDGRMVYCAIDRDTSGDSSWTGSANLVALDANSGTFRWAADVGSTVDLDGIWLDGERLWYRTSANAAGCLWIGGPTPIPTMDELALTFPLGTDGDMVYVVGPGAATDIGALRTGHRGRVFRAASGVDPLRAPYHNLAIPGGQL